MRQRTIDVVQQAIQRVPDVPIGSTKPMNDNAFCTQRTATLCERIDL